MQRIGLAALLLILALLPPVGGGVGPVAGLDEEGLQGAWEIASIQRDGEPDLAQVGGHVTFAGQRVEFIPRPTILLTGARGAARLDPALS
jgi:hypothetical protein